MKPIYQCRQSSLFFYIFYARGWMFSSDISDLRRNHFFSGFIFIVKLLFLVSVHSICAVIHDSHYFESLQSNIILYEESDFIRCYKVVELKLTVWMHWYLMIFQNIQRNHERSKGRRSLSEILKKNLRNFKKSSTSW